MKRFLVLFLFGTLQASQDSTTLNVSMVTEKWRQTQPQSLSEAVRWGSLEQVRVFLWQRWNPNAWDEAGRASMHYAVFRGSDEAIPILRALLAARGDILVKDRYGATVVDDALTLGNREALNIFIVDYGLNLTDNDLRKKYPVINEFLADFVFTRSPAIIPI